jgi:hypothetical protein
MKAEVCVTFLQPNFRHFSNILHGNKHKLVETHNILESNATQMKQIGTTKMTLEKINRTYHKLPKQLFAALAS